MATNQVDLLDKPTAKVELVEIPGGMKLPAVKDSSQLSILQLLSDEQLAEARELASQIDPQNPNRLTEMSVPVQKQVSMGVSDIFAQTRQQVEGDDPLDKVRNRELDEGGQILADILTQMEKVDPQGLINANEGLIAQIPWVGRWFLNHYGAARVYLRKFETVGGQIVELELRLKSVRLKLRTNVEYLQRMYDQKLASLDKLVILIGAGELKVQELNAELSQLKSELHPGDLRAAEEIRSLEEFTLRLERRIEAWNGSVLYALQVARWVKMIQEADQAFVDQIEDSILITLPAWRDQAYIILQRIDLKKAREMIALFKAKTNELLRTNAQLLGMEIAAAAEEVGRSIVTLDTFKYVQDKLDNAGNKVLEHRRAERARRLAEIPVLVQMQQHNINSIASINEEPKSDL